jgi:hypothetical protein
VDTCCAASRATSRGAAGHFTWLSPVSSLLFGLPRGLDRRDAGRRGFALALYRAGSLGTQSSHTVANA